MRREYYSDLVRLRHHIESTSYVSLESHAAQRVISAINDEISKLADEKNPCENHGEDIHTMNPIVLRPDSMNKSMQSSNNMSNRTKVQRSLIAARFLLLDLPLLMLFILMLGTYSMYYMYDQYYSKIIELARWRNTGRLDREFTYYKRHCDDTDVSTTSAQDFTLNKQSTIDDTVHTIMRHGVIQVPSVLSDDVSTALRSFILKRNQELKSSERIPLDGPDNRWSFAIGIHDDHAVAAALKQLSTNYILKNTLDNLLGRNPAVVEITAITAAYGASSQGWHADVKPLGSSVKYGRTFTHSYSLFIPLQNTTARIGATEVCPGTHYCTNNLVNTCSRMGFQVGGNDESTWWRMGDAVLMNQCMWHRGYAHTDPDGAERVVFILTFISRPQPGIDHRQLSHGTYFHIRPDMYGNTLYDLAAPESIRFAWPFRIFRSLGVWAPSSIHYGWDWLTTASLRIANKENGYQYNDLVEFVKNGPILRFLPSFLFGEASKGGGWTEFIHFSLQRCKDATLMVYCLLMSVYFFCAVIVAYNTGHRSSKGLLPWIKRVMITHVILVAVLFAIKVRIDKTKWSQSIKAGNIFVPFKNQYDLIESQVPSLSTSTVPEKMDVLHGIRYDAKYLGIYNNYLDFHPGNTIWLDGISSFRGYIHDFPTNIQYLALLFIHEVVKHNGGRFLIQEEDGTWTTLNESQTLEVTWKKLLPNRLVVNMLEEMRYFYAEIRFGHLSQGMKRKSLEYLKLFESKLVSAHGSIWSKVPNKTVDEDLKPRHILKSGIRLIPHTEQTSLKQQGYSRKVHMSSSSYTLGEIVEVNYLDEGRWFHGIVNSEMEDDLIHILYLDDDEETVPHERIRKFNPIMSGQTMETYVRDCSDCPMRFIRGVIKKAYPDYSYDLLLIDDEVTMDRIPLLRMIKE